jgi:O-acetyl-ADP-ribose deacetylase (regulator of RNase III)
VATEVSAVVGDIATLKMDAIVNAANTTLLGGGGVDGSIHYAAGPGLLEECRKLGGCPTGEARITLGHRLPARHVIHTVGPVWKGGTRGEPHLLAACYTNSLRLALEHGLTTVAFPSISTGAYAYPLELAAPIAVEAVRGFVAANPGLAQVTFCCYTRADHAIYKKVLGGPDGSRGPRPDARRP